MLGLLYQSFSWLKKEEEEARYTKLYQSFAFEHDNFVIFFINFDSLLTKFLLLLCSYCDVW